MVTSFKHLNFIRPFTCLSGYNSDTITELERKCRRLQTQVFQMEVQWNTVLLPPPPGLYDDLVITTIFFPPKRKKPLSHFIILNTPLMRPSRYYHQGLLSNGGGINRVPL